MYFLRCFYLQRAHPKHLLILWPRKPQNRDKSSIEFLLNYFLTLPVQSWIDDIFWRALEWVLNAQAAVVETTKVSLELHSRE